MRRYRSAVFTASAGGMFAVLVTASGLAFAASGDQIAARGEQLLNANCKRCHAVSEKGRSVHPKAPAFREVAQRYEPEHLAESLAEGIISGHPDMPELSFKPDEIDAIIAYLRQLRNVGSER